MAKLGKFGGSVQKTGGRNGGGSQKKGKYGGKTACSAPKMSNEMRSDMTSGVTHRDPYPRGLA